MWPIRSRRTLAWVTSTPHLSQIDAAVLHALVLAAEALPVGDRAEDLRAEQAVALRLERAVVDRLRLGDLAVATTTRIFSGEAEADRESRRSRLVSGAAFVERRSSCYLTPLPIPVEESTSRLLLGLHQLNVETERLQLADRAR